ncbi:MAG: hemerythrin domain-containing protein [Dehalococcoidia bacterium]
MPPRPSQPIRDEHAELLPHIEDLRRLGDAALAGAAVEEPLQRSVAFLQQHLLIHAGAEERVLYPQVAELIGAPKATATMSRDHVEVERLSSQLAAASVSDRASIARLAFGLYAIVTLHFAKEEEVYLELMDEMMSADAVAAMYGRMEDAAATLKGGAS